MVMGKAALQRIVLVHGAAHGAWCWEELIPLLESRGYEVDALDLPGMGADTTPPADITLQTYIDRVVEVVSAKPGPVLLVGHSMGGISISGAAEAVPERIGKLVYVAALLPKDGESINEIMTRNFGTQEPDRAPRGEEGVTFTAEAAISMFYSSTPPGTAARAAERLRAQPEGPFAGIVALSPSRWGALPKTYIVCTQDRAISHSLQDWFCERVPEAKKRLMETDHSPFYSDPEGLAAIIAEECAEA